MGISVASAKYSIKLTGREDVAYQTAAFRFAKPDGFVFVPGQFVNLTLINPPETDAEGNARTFSIASAPHEDFIMVTTRLRDTAFKRVLSHSSPGIEVSMEGPFGDLKLHRNASRAAVFLAGGIGITPFRSIVLAAAEQKLPQSIFLFYANRRPEDAAFLEELEGLTKINPRYKFIPCMSQMEQSRQEWHGETGRIDAPLLAKHLSGFVSPVYYIAGPPAMVQALNSMLTSRGVSEDDIHMEEFAGY
jgi:ferredoxin-NADP reductase